MTSNRKTRLIKRIAMFIEKHTMYDLQVGGSSGIHWTPASVLTNLHNDFMLIIHAAMSQTATTLWH